MNLHKDEKKLSVNVQVVIDGILRVAGLQKRSVSEDILERGIPLFIRYGTTRHDN